MHCPMLQYHNTRSSNVVGHIQRDELRKSLNNMIQNPAEEFNINNAYLMQFASVMEVWRITKLYGVIDSSEFYDTLLRCNEVVFDFIAAKIKLEEEQKYEEQLAEYRVQCKAIFKRNPNGKMLYNPDLGIVMKNKLSRTFRELQRRMDELGMLTKKHSDPTLAMGDIE